MYKYNEIPLKKLHLGGKVEKVTACTMTVTTLKSYGKMGLPIEEMSMCGFEKQEVAEKGLTVYQFRLATVHGNFIVTIEIGETKGTVTVGEEYMKVNAYVPIPNDGFKDITIAILRTLAYLVETEKIGYVKGKVLPKRGKKGTPPKEVAYLEKAEKLGEYL